MSHRKSRPLLGTYIATIVERPAIADDCADHSVTRATDVEQLSHLEDLLAPDTDHDARLRNGDVCLIARIDDHPAGVLWLNLVSHTDTYLGQWSMPSPTIAYYNQLQVATAYRRRGVGRSLVLAAVDECARQDRKALRSAVLSGNAASSALHEALGFLPVAVIRGVRAGPLTIRLPGSARKSGR